MFFAILSNQRSGSGWFETLLNSHINVSSNGEIFSVRERRQNASSVLQTLDRVYNLDWLSSASKNECSAAIGFKWMLNQVYPYMHFSFSLLRSAVNAFALVLILMLVHRLGRFVLLYLCISLCSFAHI
jgi:hypothetical protein